MPESLTFILELIGTVSFAVSGAMTGVQKGMDVFGVCILGLTTAVGGGVIRDLVLGAVPPSTFVHPVYALVAVGTALLVFFPSVRQLLGRRQHAYELVLLLMDSLGLGIFTVVGIQRALDLGHRDNLFLLVFVGVVTGVGGGVLRDVMAGNMPYIFVKHFYACASLIGAGVFLILLSLLGHYSATIGGAGSVVALRLLAARYRWSLPRAHQ